MSLAVGGGGRLVFDPKEDSPSHKGAWITNVFGANSPAEQAVLQEIDPYRLVAGSHSGFDRDQKIWEFGYTSSYADPSPWRQVVLEIFHRFINGGLCSGLAAATAKRWDLARFHGAPRMRHINKAQFTRDALYAQLQVLTNPVLLAYKPYAMTTPAEGRPRLRAALAAGPTPVLAFVPAFGPEMPASMPDSHAVAVLAADWLPNGGARLRVVDPNKPDDINVFVHIDAQGHFRYSYADLTYTSVPETPRDYYFPNFRLAAVPATVYFPQTRQPFFDLLTVGLG